MFDPLLSTLSLVSRFPIKVKFTFDPSRIDFFLPLTGILPAVLGGLVFFLAGTLRAGPTLTALLILTVQYFGFNLFHLDGLIDTADAFLGTFDREKRLAILKDPRIGVYGFFTGTAVLALKWALVCGLCPRIPRFPAALLAYPISGRFGAALLPGMAKPLKAGGLGALMKDAKPRRAAGGTLLGLGLWAALVHGGAALYAASPFSGNPPPLRGTPLPWLLLLGLPLSAIPVSWLTARRYTGGLGGYTGDALGTAVELGELIHLGAAAVILAFW
ncbi:MAG: adenosylcobinamide-GDP ribazoletransferase [Spirochaetaceae bacterium]|jgi:adenosylcobinamide-GDP ribazoletransferase|nr:adenosylcobinamide-GDP ribazoletransferase [Spirochaetaceae bacterium]